MSAAPMIAGQIDAQAVAQMLHLSSRTQAEMVDFDPRSGDYRVFDLSLSAEEEGSHTLRFALYRQGPGFQRRVFPVFTLTFSAPDAEGLSQIHAFRSDAGMEVGDLMHSLPMIANIGGAIQNKQRPDDAWILPLLSRSAKILWTKVLPKGSAA